MQTTARYAGKCYLTGKPIKPGDKIYLVEVAKNGVLKKYWALSEQEVVEKTIVNPVSNSGYETLKQVLGWFASHFEATPTRTQVFDLTSQTIKDVDKFYHKFSPYFSEKKFYLYADRENVYLATGHRNSYGKVVLDCVVVENNSVSLEDAFIVDPEIYWEAIQMLD